MIPDSKIYDLNHLLEMVYKQLIDSIFGGFLIDKTHLWKQYD